MDALFIANPSLASFSIYGIGRDAGALLLSTDVAVLTACMVGAWLAGRRIVVSGFERNSESLRTVLFFSLFFFSFLGFMLLAYVTHKQPIIFPRYGLILFALGIPMLPWTFLEIWRSRLRWARTALISIMAVCLLNASIQLVYSAGYINREYTARQVAEYLRSQFEPGSKGRIFSDDGTVLALSGIPSQSFSSSSDTPKDRAGFVAYLKEKNVEYLVLGDKDDSTPVKLFPELKDGVGNEIFRPVMHASSEFLPAELWLYQVKAKSGQWRGAGLPVSGQ
jgi:hypothetical protein